MSAGPTWGAEEPDLAAARAAGWGEADWDWERASERAMGRAMEGDWETAGELWSRALALALARFPPDDPRLGASWANSTAASFFQSGRADAKALEESRRVWTQSPGWIDRMRLEQRARGSVHHLRMEAKNRRVYETVVRRRLHDFAAEAREAVERLANGGKIAPRSLKRWRAEKPPFFGDTRKILSACLLLSFCPLPAE